MDAQTETIARLERAVTIEQERNRKLSDELADARRQLYTLQAKLIVHPRMRQEIEAMQAANPPMEVTAVALAAQRSDRKAQRPRTRRREGDSLMRILRETYPDFWKGI